ncbi:MAG: ribosome biogenesis GTPase Der [Chloroflexota bacterium]
MARKPVVALVGRPNVGKSTLFNRLIGRRVAVTDEIPGTTRDRIQLDTDWNGVKFYVIDTGGIEIYEPKGVRDTSPLAEGSADFVSEIRTQALLAIEEADVIVMLVDATHGVTGADEEIATILRRSKRPVLVAVNKTDNYEQSDASYEFYGLGLGEVFPISAIHGLGVGDLLDTVVTAMDVEVGEYEEEDDDRLKIAILGRPNVGKSSTLNKLLGEDRVIVSPVAGTTRDAVDTEIKWHGQDVVLIDTAGIRRRGKIERGTEKYSVIRALKALDRADVALLLIDAADGVTEQDQHIAGYIQDSKASTVIVINKWDAIEKDSQTIHEYTAMVRDKLNFLHNTPVLFVSALTGQRMHQVLETAVAVWENRSFRIPTSALNDLVRRAYEKHPAPVKGTRRLKIYYATQVAVNPPFILFHVNDTRLVHFTYKRYLENRLREEYPFAGTPVRMSFRPRDGNLDD